MSEMKRPKTNAIAQDIAFELELKLEKRESAHWRIEIASTKYI